MIFFYYYIYKATNTNFFLQKNTNNYSTITNNSTVKINPVVLYKNSLTQKKDIFKENKNKALVYRWVNNIDKKSYVGSSVNFSARLYRYYNIEFLKKSKRIIDSALLKYGHSNFSLEILEYCDRDNATKREQYYFDLLKPQYNILQIAGSSLGYKHNKETLDFFKNFRKVSEQTKKNLSIAATNRILTESDKSKISSSRLGLKLSNEIRNKISVTVTSLIGVPVVVNDVENNVTTDYLSLTDAAKALGVSRTAVKKACISQSILKKRYYITIKNK